MALKPDRDVLQYDISRFLGAITYGGERGGVAVATGTAPSGAGMDQTVSQVWYIADPSGEVPVGLLLVDGVNIDLTRQHLNQFKSEAQVGDKVTLMRKGWVVTNMVDVTGSAGGAVTQEATAYLGPSGKLTTDSNEGRPSVGKFMSTADEDGYYKVYIDL